MSFFFVLSFFPCPLCLFPTAPELDVSVRSAGSAVRCCRTRPRTYGHHQRFPCAFQVSIYRPLAQASHTGCVWLWFRTTLLYSCVLYNACGVWETWVLIISMPMVSYHEHGIMNSFVVHTQIGPGILLQRSIRAGKLSLVQSLQHP